MSFDISGAPLSQDEFNETIESASIEPPALWAIISVETSGSGFFDDKRPKILFERHVFSRITKHVWDNEHSEISSPTPGGYGASGENQYRKLLVAYELDRSAALSSTSWGIGQVMGNNSESLKYNNISEFVNLMYASEKNQLDAMVRFMKQNDIDKLLNAKDWKETAKRYNGKAYDVKHYDLQIMQQYERFKAGPMPDMRLRSAQLLLRYLSRGESALDPGQVDGWHGRRTESALNEFIRINSLGPVESTSDIVFEEIKKQALMIQ
jgi:hypothetical protein